MLIVKFQGGFANQLFQYAFYLKLKEDFPSGKVLADLSHYKKCKDHGGFKLNRFVDFDLVTKNNSNYEIVTEINYESIIFDLNKNYYFNGYWQEKKYFPKDLTKVKNIFNESRISKKNDCFLNKIKESTSVSVHVRRGDYVNNYMHGNIANQCYLQNSIEYIKTKVENPVFFVFSDDIQWAKNNLKFDTSEAIFISGNDDNVEQDIILMSNCKHNIISNSSFSWWAQYLNTNPDKIVITPEYWFNQQTESVKELFVENAVKLPNTPCFSETSNDNPFFSIIIPVYNTSKTLRRTLASVLNQTYTNIEVVIVDDCSTDNSYEILKAYEVRDKRIKLFHHEKNSGLLVTRLTGMRQAKGQYILFLDSDDWLELNSCEILHSELNIRPVEMLEFGYIREPKKRKYPMPKIKNPTVKDVLLNSYPVTFWNKVYCLELIKRSLLHFKEFYCTNLEDGYFTIYFLALCKSYRKINKYLHHYMTGTGISTRNNYSSEKIVSISLSYKNALEEVYSFLKDNSKDIFEYYKYFNDNQIESLCNICTADTLSFDKQIENLIISYDIIKDDIILSRIKILKKIQCSFIKLQHAGRKKKWFYYLRACIFDYLSYMNK